MIKAMISAKLHYRRCFIFDNIRCSFLLQLHFSLQLYYTIYDMTTRCDSANNNYNEKCHHVATSNIFFCINLNLSIPGYTNFINFFLFHFQWPRSFFNYKICLDRSYFICLSNINIISCIWKSKKERSHFFFTICVARIPQYVKRRRLNYFWTFTIRSFRFCILQHLRSCLKRSSFPLFFFSTLFSLLIT